MQTGGGEEWDLRCKDSAVTIWHVWLSAVGLSELLPSPWAPSGVRLRPSRDARPVPGSLVAFSPVTMVPARGSCVAQRGCAILHGPQDLVPPNEMFYQFAGDIKESSGDRMVSLGSGRVLGWDLKSLVRCVPSRGGAGGPRESLHPPGWPSGEGVGLKIQWAHARVGSNPTSGRSLLFLLVQSSHPSF